MTLWRIWNATRILLRLVAGIGGVAYAIGAQRYYDWLVRGGGAGIDLPGLSAFQETSAYTHGTFDVAAALLVVLAVYVATAWGEYPPDVLPE